MTTANKFLAMGANISVAAGVIAGAKKITAPDDSLEMWDATDLLSTSKIMAPALLDPGKVTFEVFFDGTAHAALIAAKLASPPTRLACVITGPTTDAYGFTFHAYVTKGGPSAEVAKGSEGQFELTLDTPATFTG